ncbi:uncharacterized protein LOC118766974 [Octopus sinensis]|uniref:Uncharacterized protein LOC118766974 n=1 Tax=Octopus sinensis TaxID=2607531 RepID=A0A7E6FGR1_9MOLL|nr:uncharacterized protein LOC118766974 [Octopus sinensis]
MEIFRFGVFVTVLCAYLVESVDIVITPGEVRAGGKEKVKITCIDKKYATKVYAITISKDGRDIVTIEPPKKASWVDNDMLRRSYLINTHISAGNSIATLYVTIPRGWDTGIYRCTVQKTPRPETSRPMALKVNGSSLPRMDMMLVLLVAANMVYSVMKS